MKATNQKGFSPLPIVFLLVTVGILAAGGYFVYKTVVKGNVEIPVLSLPNSLKKVTTMVTGNSIPRASESDFSFISDPLIRKHFAAQANVSAYRTVGTSSGMGEGTATTEVEMSGGDSFKMRNVQEANGKEIQHTINIDDTTYMKDYKDNSWWKETAKPVPTQKDEPKEYISFKPEDVKEEFEKEQMTFKSLGQENCGKSAPNLTCYKYEEGLGEAKITIWFDTKNFLLRKELSGFGEFSSEMLYYYDGINIKAPSPTKDVPEGKSIYDMVTPESFGAGSTMPSKKRMDAVNKMLEEGTQLMNDDTNSYPEDNWSDTGY